MATSLSSPSEGRAATSSLWPDGGPERLVARGLRVQFSGLVALDGFELELRRGQVAGLIGPNGSGKTTCLNALSGFVRPAGGSVALDETAITSWSPARRARARLARTFQGARLFGDLTVRENIEVAALGGGLGVRAARALAAGIVDRLGLAELADLEAGAVSTGDERRVGIARSVALRPAFLLLDEPAAGLDDAEGERLIVTIRALADDLGCGVLLVEHDMRVVMGTCEHLYVLDTGRPVASGPPDEVSRDPAVIAAYFGAEEADRA